MNSPLLADPSPVVELKNHPLIFAARHDVGSHLNQLACQCSYSDDQMNYFFYVAYLSPCWRHCRSDTPTQMMNSWGLPLPVAYCCMYQRPLTPFSCLGLFRGRQVRTHAAHDSTI